MRTTVGVAPGLGDNPNFRFDVTDRSLRVSSRCFCSSGAQGLKTMGTVVRTPRNHREAVPGRKNEGAKPLSRPRFSPLESLGHLSSHPGAQRLRRRIEPDNANPRFLLTVWGVGYKFADV